MSLRNEQTMRHATSTLSSRPSRPRGHTIIADRLLSNLLDNVDNYIIAVDKDTRLVKYGNRAFREKFPAASAGDPVDAHLPIRRSLNRVASGEGHTCRTEEVFVPATNQWLDVTVDELPWLDGTSVYLVNCYDITTKKQYEEGIKRLAYLDYLTSLPNRYRCENDIRVMLEGVDGNGVRGYLLFIDLDDFKVVNDCHGHDYGDGVLVAFARFLERLFSPDHQVYRIGGDEFVALMPDASYDQVEFYIQAMLERGRKPWTSMGREFYCSLSVRVAEFGTGIADAKTAMKHADIAMYHAKHQGKNNFAHYNAGLNQDTLTRTEMERQLRQAMRDNFAGFEVYYQPYHDVASNRILGAEALVRMRGDNGALMLSAEFIGLAEYLGFMVPLGEHILAQAARQCRRINDSGLDEFTININVSPSQFKQQNVVPRILDILRQSGVRPQNMVLSLGEDTALQHHDRMRRLTAELQSHGVRTAIDSFGAGTASFLDMRSLPVDWVKISPRYVNSVEDPFNGHFVRLVAELCWYTGKKVCMNGVENARQLTFCKELGVDMAQGYFLHRPGAVENLHYLLA